MSRTLLLTQAAGFVALLGAAAAATQPAVRDQLPAVDHLVFAVPDLEAGVAHVQALLGVRPAPGGQHPGQGTRNALLSLGPGIYLEVIGPDPDQPAPDRPRWFGIDAVASPTLVSWAAKADPAAISRVSARNGISLGAVSSGSRRGPTGAMLTWRYTDPHTVLGDGIVPFFIDWGTTVHPSATAPSGAVLTSLRAEHPDPASVERMLSALGLSLPVRKAPRPLLAATISSPRGVVELR